MNYQLLPDLAAMATLLTILYFLRRRHPQERVGLWLVGLLFIFLEAIAHAFYAPTGPRHIPSHIVALDAYLAAGVIFLWAAAQPLYPRTPTLRYLVVNTLPFAGVLTTYGLDVRNSRIYLIFIACGLILGIITPFLLNRTWNLGKAWWLILAQCAIWIPAGFAASNGNYRDAAYHLLFVLYLCVAIVFQLSLPRKSLGKVAIVAGFTVWSLVFFLHSWVTGHPQFIPVAAEVWDWQKFLVTIGMLLVMLEQQVASNEWYALHDQLTGLPNRRLFEDRLTSALFASQRNNTRTAVLMIDLNGFKQINDSFGHEIGDELLQHVARNLRSAIRVPDTLARLGGDEFIIIATDLPADLSAALIADRSLDRITRALRKPFSVAGKALTVTGSVGIAIYPDDTTDEILLRRLADQRMYEQKRKDPIEMNQSETDEPRREAFLSA
jgi:diguanylate cyclase